VPDGAVICRCNNVTKGAITKAWLAGSDVADATQATTGCGTCRDAIDGILSWLSTTEGAPRWNEAVAA
jgi:assimilatory nitrate reductase electron transfer subunit